MTNDELSALMKAAADAEAQMRVEALKELSAMLDDDVTTQDGLIHCSCMYMEVEAGEGLEFFPDPWCAVHK